MDIQVPNSQAKSIQGLVGTWEWIRPRQRRTSLHLMMNSVHSDKEKTWCNTRGRWGRSTNSKDRDSRVSRNWWSRRTFHNINISRFFRVLMIDKLRRPEKRTRPCFRIAWWSQVIKIMPHSGRMMPKPRLRQARENTIDQGWPRQRLTLSLSPPRDPKKSTHCLANHSWPDDKPKKSTDWINTIHKQDMMISG